MGKLYSFLIKKNLSAFKFCFAGFLLGFAFTPALAQTELSFSPASLSFTVAQNGTTANKSSTLSSSSPLDLSLLVDLKKSLNSEWLVLPTIVGELALNITPLSFGINSTGLAPGDYSDTVIASSLGYTDAKLVVNLTVTEPPVLAFSPTELSFSVAQNGSTGDKSSTLSANTGSPDVSLSKSANSDWLQLPSNGLGSLSFGINSAGLNPGTYTSTVTASADGYANATLDVTLTVTDPAALSFSPTSLSFSVTQGGSTADKSSTLSANTGSPDVNLTKSANSDWLQLPANGLGSLSFGINSAGLDPGTYTSTVTASADGYANASLEITLNVTVAPALSFSPTSLSFSVTQGGSTADKSSTLSANTGTPDVSLSKSANSDWLQLPSNGLGSLSFGINSAGLAPGDYSDTVIASANGYASAKLVVTLTVTVAPALSFSPTLLSFSVTQDGNTANKSSTLSANTGSPTVGLTKFNNSDWLVLPSPDLGSLSFGINSSGLAPGTYTDTVVASSSGYTSAKLVVTLTVTVAPALSFSPTSLSFSVIQDGSIANKSSTLSSNTGTPTVALAKVPNSAWLVVPSGALGSLSFGINSSGLAPGTYTDTVVASSSGYTSAKLVVTLTVTVAPALSFSPTTLSFSVVQNGSTANKSSTLSANTGTPTVTLAKVPNSAWLVVPSGALGSLSFGINSSGLAPGTYTDTVVASSSGYTSAKLVVTLTVTVAPALSFSPATLSFSVVQNGSTANKSSTLSANTGTPTVALAKVPNSAWLVVPSGALGSLSFGINSSGLAPGTYTDTVVASSSGYTSAKLVVTLTVTVAPALSFSPTTLSFSVVQNGSTANKSSTLSANTGTPTVTLAKVPNSAWLVVPSGALGSLSFGINSSGLAPGTYTDTVVASSSGYTSAKLVVTLTVTVAPALSFSPATLSFSVVQNGSTANKSSTLSANTGTPTVALAKVPNSAWLVVPAAALGSLSFGINSSGLAPGTYTDTVVASSSGYTSAKLVVTLTVTVTPALSFSPTSLSFSVVQNGSTANKSSMLSANTGTPTVALAKVPNSAWLVVPAAALGSLSFGINSSGLAPGTYTDTVVASSSGYTSAKLVVTLTVTVTPALSFSPTSLSFSVVQNGSTANKSSTLSANTGTPTVALAKVPNSAWLILPSAALGSLSFGINSSGLAPGTYTDTVVASSSGYTSAKLVVTLTVTVTPALSFSPTTLSFSVVQNGSTANKSSTLSANTGTPTVTLTKVPNSAWLVVPSAALGSLSFGINSSGLAPGTYTDTVVASSSGYTSAKLVVTLTVTVQKALSFSPTTLSFSVVQNSTTTNKSSTLSANTGTPTVTLAKVPNSAWLALPSAALGSLSFGINSSGLAPGTYTDTVVASSSGYTSAKLVVTLTVTVQKTLSFSPTTLSFSVVQNSTTTNKSSTLSANTGTPTVTLAKVPNSAWLVLPSAALGSLSFGINSSGLAPGTYTDTVVASSSGYTSAKLVVTLTVTAPKTLSFSPTTLAFSVVQNSTTANKSSTLSANTGTPTVTLTKSATWIVLPSPALGSLSFGISSSGLAPGTYNGTITAAATGYTGATIQVTLTVTAPKTLSFSPTTLAFSVVQNSTTANKSSTLSANTGTPTVTLTKSAAWIVLPSPALGSLSFGISSSGLAPGTYNGTITAAATGYTSATIQVSLTVTAPKTLSFSPTSLSFSVVQNSTTANKSSTLSANAGTPTVTLTKSTTWIVLPSPALGSLSFGISSSGLAPGTYNGTITAAATGYTSATIQVTLTVTAPKTLSFSPTSLSFSLVQNGSTANKSSTLSANSGTPTVTLTKSAAWIVLPSAALGSLSFGVNSSGLAPGTYNGTVTAAATGYTSGALQITLTVTTASLALNIKVNFQDSATVPPSGWLRDYGQSYGARTSANQGSGYSFGWLKRSDNTPLNLTKNGRKRAAPSDILLATLMHMQGNNIVNFTGTPIEGIWQAKIANGKYDVSVSVGDDNQIDSKHSINVEGVSAISLFAPTSTVKFKSATVTVSVSDGFLTIDAIGGTNTKINWVTIQPARPTVVSVNPQNGATNVSENTSISTNVLKLPNSGINNATITSSNVFLTENATGTLVPSNVNGTGGGDAITLVPAAKLKLNTTYKFNVTSGVKDLSGASFYPYTSTFTTTATTTTNPITAKFDKINLPNAVGRHSNLTIGPDGKLYAVTIDGIIKRFTINSNGTLGTPQLMYSLQDAYGTRTPRLAVGFAFDPSATATNLVAWITHDTYLFTNAPDWDGRLTKLSGSNLQTVTHVLTNLPRSARDHVTNSIAFGPDGALYFNQGSISAMGKADQNWSNRDEHLLSAAVLRLDVSKLGTLPLNVKTSEGGGTYNPYATNAPLTIYASGVRNAYDLLWHSNGSLYVPTNGSAAGGNTPASVNGTLRPNGTTYNGPSVPALTNVQQTMNDYLFRVVKGGFYGHPNPRRGEYVMNGGNPTSGVDKAEVPSYPVGTLPDVNWRGNAFDFKNNVSPNGVIEYKSSTFNGALKGKLLVVRYSQHDDIITLTPGSTKDITSSIEGNAIPGFSGFIDPLDLVEDTRNGNIYVSEYGGDTGKITLLRPNTSSGRAAQITASKPTVSPQNYPNTNAGCDEMSPVVDEAENEVTPPATINTSKKITVHPNPVQNRFSVEFPNNYQGNFTLQITDLLGGTYDIGKTRLKGEGSTMEIDISKFSLKAGVYFLKVTSENSKTEIIKLIVL